MTEVLTEEGFENGLTYQHAPYNGYRKETKALYREEDGMYCNFQLDGSAALPGCTAEMIVQSHMGEIQLLPALPDEFSTGKLTGDGVHLKSKGSQLVATEMWKVFKSKTTLGRLATRFPNN